MTLHYQLTGKPFEINPDTITLVWLLMGLEGAEVCRDSGRVTCLEDLDEMQAALKAEGLKFAKLQYMHYNWAYCLINTDKIQYLEAKEDSTRIQVGFDYDGEILVDLPMEQVLNLLAAAMR